MDAKAITKENFVESITSTPATDKTISTADDTFGTMIVDLKEQAKQPTYKELIIKAREEQDNLPDTGYTSGPISGFTSMVLSFLVVYTALKVKDK